MADENDDFVDDNFAYSKTFAYPSPNFDERDPAVKLQYIVVHYTGMASRDKALKRMADPASKVSAHHLVDEDGRVFQMVPEEKRAWHAGKAFWKDVTDMNSASIGVELVNRGHTLGYSYYPPAQVAAVKVLLEEIAKRHRMKRPSCFLGHSDIAPGRKEDPGELFPWQELAKESLGTWPQTEPDDYAPIQDFEEQGLLRALGYACPESGHYDPGTRNALIAFQRRYDQNNVTGTPERETMARMRALVRMIA